MGRILGPQSIAESVVGVSFWTSLVLDINAVLSDEFVEKVQGIDTACKRKRLTSVRQPPPHNRFSGTLCHPFDAVTDAHNPNQDWGNPKI